jgi:hypothetical protein
MAKSRKARQNKRSASRARRFSIHAPVRYRVGKGPWRHGTTENISRSGLLLHPEEPASPDAPNTPNTPIELVVDLPSVLEGEGSAKVVCRGRIVRAPDWDNSDETLLAAEITTYRIGRDESGAPRKEDT